MKVIIAGSRTIQDYPFVVDSINEALFEIDEVVSGTASGPDIYGAEWAWRNKIPVKHFPANWDQHGKSAGYIRNIEMAEYADALIAIWDGKSKGTKHMIDIMLKKDKPVKVFIIAC